MGMKKGTCGELSRSIHTLFLAGLADSVAIFMNTSFPKQGGPIPPFLVPDASLVVEANGTTLAVLQPLSQLDLEKAASEGTDKTVLARARIVHFQKVQPGRDYGTTLEILDGLEDGEYVVVNPGDAVREGALVQMADTGATSNSNQTPGASK